MTKTCATALLAATICAGLPGTARADVRLVRVAFFDCYVSAQVEGNAGDGTLGVDRLPCTGSVSLDMPTFSLSQQVSRSTGVVITNGVVPVSGSAAASLNGGFTRAEDQLSAVTVRSETRAAAAADLFPLFSGTIASRTAGTAFIWIDFEITDTPQRFRLTGEVAAPNAVPSGDSATAGIAIQRRGSNGIYTVVSSVRAGAAVPGLPASAAVDERDTLEPGEYRLTVAVNSFATVLWPGGSKDYLSTADVNLSFAEVRIPTVVVPGIGGTYPTPSKDVEWLTGRGAHPSTMHMDPLTRAYDDLLQTLENVGFQRDVDLFPVTYDWRLPPGPIDGSLDGWIDGLTAENISSGTFRYGVDYLGYALRQAAEQWAADHPDEPPLEEVDVIAHSTGGLVARTYMQSNAYGGSYAADRHLPRIRKLVLVGVPNRGAAKAWNPLHDNWITDFGFRMVLSKIIYRAWLKVRGGAVISGPEYSIPGGPACTRSPEQCFIEAYVPTARSLLATYPFLDNGAGPVEVNGDPGARNTFLLDLNGGPDPNAFASAAESVAVFYGTSSDTPATSARRVGPSIGVCTGLSSIGCVISEFHAPFARIAAIGETYFRDLFSPSGDGTVPEISSAGPFLGDPRITLRPFAGVEHVPLMHHAEVQRVLLETLDLDFEPHQISTTLEGKQLRAILSVINDPVDGFVVDALGRRLGYTEETGALTEIPGSVWFGNADGIGWIFESGEPLQLPLRLHLIGRGEPYVVQVTVADGTVQGGLETSGTLAPGERVELPVPVGEASTPSAFEFTGFLAPVRNDVVNAAKAGQAIPMKFMLGGDFGLDVLAAGYPTAAAVPCVAGAPTDLVTVAAPAGQSALTYDAATATYTYVWKTDKSWANSCRTFVLQLRDGSEHTAAFLFTR